MRRLRNEMEAAGIPIENSKGEWGPGQEEINVRYAEVLEMADRHVILKNGAKEIAGQEGKAITFMAKYNYGLAGNSSHIHNSLWSADGKTPLFFDKKGEWTLSKLGQQWAAGQLKYAKEFTWFLAPYINSYKRFQSGTFAPTKIMWSEDNRTAGFRLCGEGTKGIRMECRIGGADLNPYLAFAALIAAGLAGIDEKLELQKPFVGDAYQATRLPEIPKTLREATETMAKSKMLKAALGEEVVEHYVHTARWEQFEYDRRITDWELHRGSSGIDRQEQEKDEDDMTETIKLKSPIDGSIYAERPVADDQAINAAVERARAAQVDWAQTSIASAANTCSPCSRRWSP